MKTRLAMTYFILLMSAFCFLLLAGCADSATQAINGDDGDSDREYGGEEDRDAEDEYADENSDTPEESMENEDELYDEESVIQEAPVWKFTVPALIDKKRNIEAQTPFVNVIADAGNPDKWWGFVPDHRCNMCRFLLKSATGDWHQWITEGQIDQGPDVIGLSSRLGDKLVYADGEMFITSDTKPLQLVRQDSGFEMGWCLEGFPLDCRLPNIIIPEYLSSDPSTWIDYHKLLYSAELHKLFLFYKRSFYDEEPCPGEQCFEIGYWQSADLGENWQYSMIKRVNASLEASSIPSPWGSVATSTFMGMQTLPNGRIIILLNDAVVVSPPGDTDTEWQVLKHPAIAGKKLWSVFQTQDGLYAIWNWNEGTDWFRYTFLGYDQDTWSLNESLGVFPDDQNSRKSYSCYSFNLNLPAMYHERDATVELYLSGRSMGSPAEYQQCAAAEQPFREKNPTYRWILSLQGGLHFVSEEFTGLYNAFSGQSAASANLIGSLAATYYEDEEIFDTLHTVKSENLQTFSTPFKLNDFNVDIIHRFNPAWVETAVNDSMKLVWMSGKYGNEQGVNFEGVSLEKATMYSDIEYNPLGPSFYDYLLSASLLHTSPQIVQSLELPIEHKCIKAGSRFLEPENGSLLWLTTLQSTNFEDNSSDIFVGAIAYADTDDFPETMSGVIRIADIPRESSLQRSMSFTLDDGGGGFLFELLNSLDASAQGGCFISLTDSDGQLVQPVEELIFSDSQYKYCPAAIATQGSIVHLVYYEEDAAEPRMYAYWKYRTYNITTKEFSSASIVHGPFLQSILPTRDVYANNEMELFFDEPGDTLYLLTVMYGSVYVLRKANNAESWDVMGYLPLPDGNFQSISWCMSQPGIFLIATYFLVTEYDGEDATGTAVHINTTTFSAGTQAFSPWASAFEGLCDIGDDGYLADYAKSGLNYLSMICSDSEAYIATSLCNDIARNVTGNNTLENARHIMVISGEADFGAQSE